MPRARTLVAGALALALLGAAALQGPYLWAGMGIAPAYTAKVLCSCVFVSERDPQRCLATDLGGFWFVDATLDRAAREVRADVLRLRSARATYEPGRGCTLR